MNWQDHNLVTIFENYFHCNDSLLFKDFTVWYLPTFPPNRTSLMQRLDKQQISGGHSILEESFLLWLDNFRGNMVEKWFIFRILVGHKPPLPPFLSRRCYAHCSMVHHAMTILPALTYLPCRSALQIECIWSDFHLII